MPVWLKPTAVRMTASAKERVCAIAPWVAYEPKEKPMTASLEGAPRVSVYLPLRTSGIRFSIAEIAVKRLASKPESLVVQTY